MDLWSNITRMKKFKSIHTKLMHKKLLYKRSELSALIKYFNINALLNFKEHGIVLIIFKNE